jgi:hypothetical protein
MPIFFFSLWLFHNKKRWYYFDHGILLYIISSLLLLFFVVVPHKQGTALNRSHIYSNNNFIGIWMDVLLFLSSTPSFLWETRVVSFIKLACCFYKFHLISITFITYMLFIPINLH